ncbi:adenosylhomocysteinase [Miltoncostaea oceani]|uniref:adenosylhomocysteinase n=1 Tax=Miltoncostaea oceani TaxID=2843216 RepID=UPI001C3C8E1F|nr:adenosylhomocysteinase [Miltoncostaea oceani]
MTAASPPPHDVADLGLAPLGRQRIEWADRDMPVLRSIRERFARETPLAGLRISACLHVTTETAALARTLRAGGADLVLVASNPLSTQDDVAAALVADFGVATYARRGEDEATYYRHVTAAIDHAPRITMDDGADVIGVLHGERREMLDGVIGGTEDTTTGVIRLRALEREGGLAFPVISVNDADTSHMFDNTGQSTIDGLLRATNLLVAGRQAVVAGFGPFGRGVAGRLRGMGAHVIVLEVDPRRALEAVLDGFPVMTVAEAARLADVFITATGDVDVLRPEHMREMKDGAILANTGHFNVEIDVAGLAAMARAEREVRPGVREFLLPDGRRLNLLAEGRLVNLACAEGHPASVMDMSFANQALCAEFLAREGADLEARVYPVPPRIDEEIAKLKLAALGVRIDVLTDDQARYLASWEQGT